MMFYWWGWGFQDSTPPVTNFAAASRYRLNAREREVYTQILLIGAIAWSLITR